jgi:hypothetical protein
VTWLAVALGAAAGAAVALMLIGAYQPRLRRRRRTRFLEAGYEQRLQALADAEQARRRARLNVQPTPRRDRDDWGVEEWHG